MAVKVKKSVVTERRERKRKPEIPLGVMKAKVLKKLDMLGNQAFGYEVVKVLFAESEGKEWIDPSVVYGIMRELVAAALIRYVGSTAATDRGPPMKIYQLTPAGHIALKATSDFYRRLAAYLEA